MPATLRSCFRLLLSLFLLACLPACFAQAGTAPPPSTYLSTFAEESYSTYQLPGNGDLWPSCWSNDDNLYAANGDGTGFSSTFAAMRVARISGMPPNLVGSDVAGDIGKNYTGSTGYTDKPTGMACVTALSIWPFRT